MSRKENQNNHLKITIIYDNEVWTQGLQADWGFSCLVHIPGLNDSTEEMRKIAKFIQSVSPAIPWHVTALSVPLIK